MHRFSFKDLNKHIEVFENLKYQIYISNEIYDILENFCSMICPVYKDFLKKGDFSRLDLVLQQFYNCCVSVKGKDFFLHRDETPKYIPIHTSYKLISTMCSAAASVLESEELHRLKSKASQRKYIHQVIREILPEIKNGAIVRFNQLIELTRKSLIDVVVKDQVCKTGHKSGIIQNNLKQNKADIFRHAKQLGIIPSADVLINYQQARDIIFAHPGNYPTDGLSLRKGQKYINKKGMTVQLNPSYFGDKKILENYEKILCSMMKISEKELQNHINLTVKTKLSTNALEAGISIDYLEHSRQLRNKIETPLSASQKKETKQDKTLRNRLEHANETPKTIEKLRNRQEILSNKNNELTLHWIWDILSNQRK